MFSSEDLDEVSRQIFNDKITNSKEEEKSILQKSTNAVDMRGYYTNDKFSNTPKDYAFTNWDRYQIDSQKIFEQELFWLHFLSGQPKQLSSLSSKDKKQLKSIVREGIPDSYRGKAYCYLLDVPLSITQQQIDTYKQLLAEPPPHNGKGVVQISKDIDRTMPTLNFFRSEKTLGQLFRILKAYEASGKLMYTQGMNFPAAVFLFYLPEVSAFFCFQEFMERFGSFILGNQFEQAKFYIYVIKQLAKKFNKQLFTYMEQSFDQQQDMLYFSWMVAFFSSPFCMELQLRLFEQLLFEGKKIFIKVPLALLSYASCGKFIGKFESDDDFQKYINELPFKKPSGNGISVISMPEHVGLLFLQDVGGFLDNPDWFIKEHLLKIKFSRKNIDAYRSKYQDKISGSCSTNTSATNFQE